MKKLGYSLVGLFLASAFLLSGCKNLEKMTKNAKDVKYKVSPSPLEMHGGKVKVSINGTFPAKYFVPNAVVEATPVLKYAGQEKELKKMIINGENINKDNGISWATGGAVTYSAEFDYVEDMKVAELVLDAKGQLMKKGEVTKEGDLFEDYKLADGIIVTPLLYKKGLEVDNATANSRSLTSNAGSALMHATAEQGKPTPKTSTFTSDVHYGLQQSMINYKEKKADDIVAMKEAIQNAESEQYVYKGISLTSAASPDGPVDLNTKLAEQRSTAAEKFLRAELKRMKLEKDGDFNKKTTAEDWEGFQKELGASSLSAEDKSLIKRVLSMYNDPEVRETEIKKIAAAYNELRTEVLPKLRRSKIDVNYQARTKSDAELLEMAKAEPTKLSDTELLYAAQLAKNTGDKVAIYKSVISQYPNNWEAPLNLGSIYLEQGKTSDAKAMFEKANSIEKNEKTQNNLGVVAFMEGNYEEAANYFSAANVPNSPASYNLGVLAIIDGDYAKAVSNFGSSKTFNAALATLLSGDSDGAKAILNSVENKDAAYVDYLYAVIAARNDDKAATVKSLSSAIAKDASIKSEAVKDAEFFKFKEDAEFQAVVK